MADLVTGGGGTDGLVSVHGKDGEQEIEMAAGLRSTIKLGNKKKDGRLIVQGGVDGFAGVQLNVANRESTISAGAKDTPGEIRLNNGKGAITVSLDSDTGIISCGANGVTGRVTAYPPNNNQPSVELFGSENESVIQVGQPNHPGRISVYNAQGEAVRLDGVRGDIVLGNADCAEDFDLAVPGVEPGTVMVLTDTGTLAPSEKPYDTRVVGVVSGAGTFRPALILDRRSTAAERAPIALLGKVYCCIDATEKAVRVGDLLTTAERPGHAMPISDPTRAWGAVLGKALATLNSGRALIPILVTLQ